MAGQAKSLTNTLCKNLSEGRHRDAATPGLYLKVGKSSRTFVFISKIRGRTIFHKIGKMSDGIDLAEARLRAGRARELLASGETLQPESAALSPDTVLSYTFNEAWDRYVAERLSTISSGKETEGFVRFNALDHFAARPLQSVTRTDAINFSTDLRERVKKRQNAKLRKLGKPEKDNAGHATTRATHVALRTFYNWCIKHDLAQMNPFEKTMPELKEESRDRVLSFEEVAIVMDALSEHKSPTYRGIVDTLIFTAMRLGEVTALRFGWIDFNDKEILVPKEFAKNKKVNIVALSDRAIEIFREQRATAEADPDLQEPGAVDAAYVFSTGVNCHYSAESKDKKKLDEIIATINPNMPEWRHHDLRRTVATRAAKNGVMHECVERGILRHYPDKLTGTYQIQPYIAPARDALNLWVEQIDKAQTAWEEVRRDVIWANNNLNEYAEIVKSSRERENLEGRIVAVIANTNGNGGEIIREGGILNRDKANAEITPQGSRYGRGHTKRNRLH